MDNEYKMNLAKLFAEGRANVIKRNTQEGTRKIESKIDKFEKTDLGTIKGVGDTTVKVLLEHGIATVDELKKGGEDLIKDIKLNPFSLKAIKELFK